MNREYVIYALVFACVFLIAQAVIGGGRQALKRTKLANERLRRLDTDEPAAQVMKQMRKERNLHKNKHMSQALNRLHRALVQSGLKLSILGFGLLTVATTIGLAIAGLVLRENPIWIGVGAGVGLILPALILKKLCQRRMMKAASQLPEALDVVVRSLGAGHPVPVALALVGREMADPLGSEFGMACDEIAYGSPLSEAVQRISDRIGQEDFDLFAANIRLQSRTGGNLAELLRNNAKTIRDRQKMRMKIKAASAEGRMSAIILNVAPILLYVAVNAISPEFYGEVEDSPYVKYGLMGVVVWMVIGNLVMRRMINFRI